MNDLVWLLGVLERAGVEYTRSPINNKKRPDDAHMVEFWNSEDYGIEDLSTVWVFNKDGALLRIGHF